MPSHISFLIDIICENIYLKFQNLSLSISAFQTCFFSYSMELNYVVLALIRLRLRRKLGQKGVKYPTRSCKHSYFCGFSMEMFFFFIQVYIYVYIHVHLHVCTGT